MLRSTSSVGGRSSVPNASSFIKSVSRRRFEHGIAVIEKYSTYADTGPYFDPGDGAWQLKFRHRMENGAVCEPSSLTKTTPRSAGKHIARIEVEETDSDSDDDDLTVCTDSTLTAGESSDDSNDKDSGSTETLDDMLARHRVRR